VSQTIPYVVGCLSVTTGDFEAMTRELIAVIVCNRDPYYHLKALRYVAVNLHRFFHPDLHYSFQILRQI
jgi:hypothetical protein